MDNGTPRATYVKLSAIDLEALRLALHDPETRLAVGAIPGSGHTRIRSMSVDGAGFLGKLEISWNDDLNVIIGGRGVGKSAILETLRYALDVKPYADSPYREELVRHALGSGGRVSVVLERPVGSVIRRYLVTRVWGERAEVAEADSKRPIDVQPSALLGPSSGPVVLGQREILAVSFNDAYRLALLDELIGDEARNHADAVRQAVEGLRANARQIVEVRERLLKREDYRQKLAAVDHEISVYKKHGAAEKLSEVTRLYSDGQHLRTAGETVRTAQQRWVSIEERLLPPIDVACSQLRQGESKQRGILEESAKILAGLREGLHTLLDKGGELLAEAQSRLDAQAVRWQQAIDPLEEDINRIKQEAHRDALDPDRLLRLTEERTALAPLIADLERSEGRLKELLTRRQGQLSEVKRQRYQEHQLRRQRAGEIAELVRGRLRLTVEFKGQKGDFRKRLSSLLRGSRLTEEAIASLVAPDAMDGIALAEAAHAGLEEVKSKFGLTPGMAERLVDWLTSEESRIFELQTLIPADALQVELKVGDEYRPLERLSAGQQATAILLLLFALEGRILVLDQPEDDLDNRFVYEDIVQILRGQKGLKDQKRRRQVIAATHNPNIPVLGDAELVLALEVREGRAYVVGRASIDSMPVRELIESIMEGGRDAFRRRAEKYGGVQGLSWTS